MRKYLLTTALSMILLLSISSFASAKMRIAVMDFKAKRLPKATANMVSELIRTEMINVGKFTVIERAQMDEILKEQGFQQSGCTDMACAVKIGKMLSAKKMLVGTVMKLGKRIIINGRLVDVEKGIGIFGQKQDAKNEDALYDAVASFVRKLTKRIGGEIEEEEEEEDSGPGFFARLFGGDDKEDAAKSSGSPTVSLSGYQVTLGGPYLMTGGEFANMADPGFGGLLSLSINGFLFNQGVLTFSFGYYMFSPTQDWIDSITTMSGTMYLPHTVQAK